ncbi:MAG: hypothetical protein LBH93_04850 [Chitinispirillales bacterium]|jgi:hypothetical protein|nr:hypothetical protein [Chitinispirillales bacterium]
MMTDTKYNSGGVALRLAVCAMSLLVLAAAIFALMRTFEAGKADDDRRALSQCELGLQEAFTKLSESRGWSEGIAGGPDERGDSFAVAFRRENRGGAPLLKITSTGTGGSVVKAKECTLRLEVSEEGDSSWVNEGIR